MAHRNTVGYSFGLLFIGLLIVACGPDFQSAATNLSPNVCNSSSKPGAFSAGKLQLATGKGLHKAAVSGDKVSVRVDAQCVSRHPSLDAFLGLSLTEQNGSGMVNYFNFNLVATDYSIDDLQTALAANPCVLGIGDYGLATKSATSDPNVSQQRHLTAHNYQLAYDYFYTSGEITEDVVIAVVDTGIDYNHPDLKCNMWQGNGYDFVNNDADPMDDDPQGHGTHVAGLIGACANNGVGGTGVMGSRVKLMAVKTLNNQGAGEISAVANGIDWAVDNGADIINLSLEAPGRFAIIRDAIQRAVRAGVLVVGAAGNGNQEITNVNPVTPAIDADIGGMIAVGAVDATTLQLSSYSNRSSTYVEIVAAGSNRSLPTLEGIYSTEIGGGYTRISGTSQSAPLVAGTIGLMIGFLKSRNIAYSPTDIEGYLRYRGTLRSAALMGRVADGALLDWGVLAANLRADYGNTANSSLAICP